MLAQIEEDLALEKSEKHAISSNSENESDFALEFDLNSVSKKKFKSAAIVSEEESDEESLPAKPEKLKKPKESLKALLKETGALIRQTAAVELPISVAKPKPFSSILNEALATAAQSTESGRQAHRALLEEKRRAQQTRLQKLLGPERLAQLSSERPKIGGQAGLNEEFRVSPGETLKLVNLPDGRGNSSSSTPRKRTSYALQLPRHTPASIDVLNEKLAEKIAAQSTRAAARISAQIAQEAARARAVAAAAERKRQAQLAEKERKLEAKRQEVKAGRPNFQEASAKPAPLKKNLKATLALQPMKPRIILSDDDEAEPLIPSRKVAVEEDPEFVDYDADLAEEGFVVSQGEEEDEELDELEDESEAEFSENETDDDGLPAELSKVKPLQVNLDAFLSGKFDSQTSTTQKQASQARELKVELVKTKRRSNFLDDEAEDEDEDEELDAEMYDEEALEQEMLESKFIADEGDDDGGEGSFDPRAVHHELKIKEEMQLLDRLATKFAKKPSKEDAFLARLESKYSAGALEDEDEEFDEDEVDDGHGSASQRKLIKLAELERFNPAYLQKSRRSEIKATREFLFPEEVKAAQQRERAYLDQSNADANVHGHSHSYPSSHPSSDFYSSAAEDSETDFEKQEEEEEAEAEDEKAMYEQEGDNIPAEIDLENDQVEASESLNATLKSMNEISFDFSNSNTNDDAFHCNSSLLQSTLTSSGKAASVMVPRAKDAMKAKLVAMQQSEEGPTGNKVFKGFASK